MIEEILKDHIVFEGVNNSAKFASFLTSLYRIEIFKNGLDLILTKVRSSELKFEVKIIKGWDTNVGCYLTEQDKIHNKLIGVFSPKLKHKIILRNLVTNVMAHEMAHALEVESGLVLNDDFRKAIGFDMKDHEVNNLGLRSAIKRVMVEGIKPYPKHQIISELFARYFEVLSVSRNVNLSGDFDTKDVTEFFANTTKWIEEIFNPAIKSKIDQDIANYTRKLIDNDEIKAEKKFTDKIDSFYKKVDSAGNKSWSSNTGSNLDWQKSWEKHQEIEDKNKK